MFYEYIIIIWIDPEFLSFAEDIKNAKKKKK